ncbi:MAG: sialate O-acetylesterase [Phycisphaerae bacterium]|nr:sialate O-acetylesterase [Phycisphaerae bacterium]
MMRKSLFPIRAMQLCAGVVLMLLGLAATSGPALAKVQVISLFGNHMVLQRHAPDPVWGTAAPGEPVTVSIGGQRLKTVANGRGKWMVRLAPMKATAKPLTLTIAGASNVITIHDVLVGEVWLSSGQSNMSYPLGGNHPKVKVTPDPELRLFHVPFISARYPKHNFDTAWKSFPRKYWPVPKPLFNKNSVNLRWQLCTAQSANPFSAVAYFFARDLQEKLHVPVGIINNSVSGSVAQAWTSLQTLKRIPRLRPLYDQYQGALHWYPIRTRQYDQALAQWRATGRAKGLKKPKPFYYGYSPFYWEDPAHLLNGMLIPLIPYRIRGVIWYQGEFNAGYAWQYRKLLPAMIGDWRRLWGEGNFPFYIVQLPGVQSVAKEPQDPSWAKDTWSELREAQARTARRVPNCGLVVTVDTVSPHNANLHPPRKRPVGKRLALLALAKVYHQKVVYSGPVFKKMQIQGHKLRLLFRHVDGGLTSNGKPIIGFAVAGRDKKFYWAKAKIDGPTVVVSSAKVPHPAAVRYAWGLNPQNSLYNRAQLPMAPFRTDHWTEYSRPVVKKHK